MTLGGDVDFDQIAKKTPGFVGADLSSLTKEAAVVAINRIFTRLRAMSPPPEGSSTPPSTAAATRSSSTSLPLGNPHEALGNGGGSGAAGGEAAAAGVAAGGATAKGSPPTAAATIGRGTCTGEGGVANGCGGSPTENSMSLSLSSSSSNSPAVHDGIGKTDVAGPGGEEGAEAVGGFLAGPLSAAQLAPLSVTMEDFLMAVKKVSFVPCDVLAVCDILGVLGRS